MTSNLITVRRLLILGVLTIAASGCVKKRPTVEGDNQNLAALVSIRTLETTTCEIRTKDVKQNVNNSVTQQERISTSSSVGIKNLNYVNFDSNCPYIQGATDLINLRAQPNTVYKAGYEVDSNNVTLFKYVTSDQLTLLEKPSAKPFGTLWKVPVGGFEITGFFTVGRAKNSDNRDTNQLERKTVDSRDFLSATHVAFKQNFESFKIVVKTDVMPKDYFKGDWYFNATDVYKRIDTGQGGSSANTDAGFHEANKIAFLIEQDKLIAYNTNIDSRLVSDKHDLNLNAALRIPIRGTDYRRKIVGNGFGLEDEEIPDVRYQDAKFIALDFKKAESFSTTQTAIEKILNSLSSNFNYLVVVKDLVIEDNYFSFTLEDRGTETVTTYSFMRVLPDRPKYTPQISYADDMLKFGFFTSKKSQIIDEKLQSRRDDEKITFVNHFNPNVDIVYYFSNVSPNDKWVRDIGREAVNLWQQAFAKAGIKTKIVLKDAPSDDKDLGDIRYNIINLNNDLGGLLGLGPSLADPDTGEIISATSNLYVETERKSVLASLRRYVGEQIGQRFDFMSPNTIGPALGKLDIHKSELLRNLKLALNNPQYDSKTRQLGAPMFPKLSTLTDANADMGASVPLFSDADLKNLTNGKFESFSENYGALSAESANFEGDSLGEVRAFTQDDWVTTKLVENMPECEGIRNLVAKYKAAPGVPSTEELLAASSPCAIPMTQYGALAALVHEMGHNLGLRHNFMGTADKANFFAPEDFNLTYLKVPRDMAEAKSSSIMDYYDSRDGLQVYPGKYDVAALRFAYANKIETAGGQIKSIDTNKTISENLGDDTRRFYFCTDEHNYFGSDPLCAQFDVGTSALHMVTTSANSLFRALSGTYRYQAAPSLWVSPAIDSTIAVTVNRLLVIKKQYDRWRILLSQELGEGQKYLSNMSTEEYKAVIDRLLKSPRKSEVEDLIKARNVAVMSLVDLAFMSNRYCVSANAENKTVLIELAKIRKSAQRMGFLGRIDSCQSAEAMNQLKSLGLTFKSEVGFDLDMGSYEVDPVKELTNPDFIGTGIVRLFAMTVLTTRRTQLRVNSVQGFSPSMMDEPDIRDFVTSLLQDRVINGAFVATQAIDTKSYAQARTLNQDDVSARLMEADGKTPQTYTNYEAESALLMQMTGLMYQSLYVPGDASESGLRIRPYQTVRTQQPEVFKDRIKNQLQVDATTYIVTTVGSDQSLASQMIDKLSQINQMSALAALPLDQVKQTFVTLNELLTKNNLLLDAKTATNLDFVKYGMAIQNLYKGLSADNKTAIQARVLAMTVGQDIPVFNKVLQTVIPLAQAAGMDQKAFFALLQKLVDGGAPVGDGETQIADGLKKPFDGSAYKSGEFPDAAGLKVRADNIASMIASSQVEMTLSGQDINAQKNMLFRFLSFFSN